MLVTNIFSCSQVFSKTIAVSRIVVMFGRLIVGKRGRKTRQGIECQKIGARKYFEINNSFFMSINHPVLPNKVAFERFIEYISSSLDPLIFEYLVALCPPKIYKADTPLWLYTHYLETFPHFILILNNSEKKTLSFIDIKIISGYTFHSVRQ